MRRSRSALRLLALLTGAAAGAAVLTAVPPVSAEEVPQLTVTLSDQDAHPARGELYTLSATVRNDGTETVRAARLVHVVPTSEMRLLPASVRTDAGQVTIGHVLGALNNLISIELGALTPGESLSAAWKVRVRTDVPPALESFNMIVTAERTADDGYPSTLAGDYDLQTELATPLAATLSGAQVEPGPGDRDGTGTAALRVVPAIGEICSTVSVEGIRLPARRTVVGADGQPAAPLPGPDASGVARGCTGVGPELARALTTGTGGFVRVDNGAFPRGALAGPLTRP